ncbi:Vps5 C terminal like-domain-containing protein [Parasitella parasitica]|nr:Vps5 C terminal like-domain-containing protein [Parasitella parasitica]
MATVPRIQFMVTNVDYRRKDPVFWIEVQTNITKYKQKQKRFPRYYSELVKLHAYLSSTCDDVLIPALPPCPSPRFDKEGKLVGRQWWLTIRLPGEESASQGDTGSVENKIQLWFDRIVEHDRTRTSEGLRAFVESEVGFRPSIVPQQHPPQKIKTPKYIIVHVSSDDMEPEFGHFLKELDTFSHNLHQVSARLDKLVQEQNSMARSWMNLSSSWVSYGGIERNASLFILYKAFAKGHQQLADLERSQASAINETLSGEISYELKNCESTQNVMQRRLDALSNYLSSRKHTESSLRRVERLKSSISIDRDQASEAIAVLEDARILERNNLQRFERVDTNLRQDIENQFKPNTARDMMQTVKEYAKSQLFLEKKKLAVLQEIMVKQDDVLIN